MVIETTYIIMLLFLVVLVLLWRVVCKELRKKRAKMLAKLDPIKDCNIIAVHTLYVEFPFLARKAGEVSILRSFALPSIRRILQRAGEFKKRPSKRYDDTEILMEEFMHHHVDSQRGSMAIRRINYIHSLYSDITNEQMLGALAILVLTPMDLCETYGYRPWTLDEKLAFFNVWRNVSTRMGIHHVPPTLDALRIFLHEFETTNLAYSPENAIAAAPTLSLWLSSFPVLIQPLLFKFMVGVLDQPFLKAMGWPIPSTWFLLLARFMLKLHGFFVQNFLPPRPLSRIFNRIFSPTINKLSFALSCPLACMSMTPNESSNIFDADVDQLFPLKFHHFEPVTYPNGYCISNIGSAKPGMLGTTYPGELTCPILKSSN